jgi:regulator of sigma E protease
MGVVVGILILSIMMIVHELGHFMMGRRLGFKIEEFSIFMGPVLFSWTRKSIKYSIKLFPIGASVRFAGEFSDDGTPVSEPGHFYNRPKWMRALVIGTGPALNLLAGVLALFLMFSIFGYFVPVIDTVYPDTLAADAGVQSGERLLSVNGYTVATILDYQGITSFINAKTPLELRLRGADGTTRAVTLQPRTEWRYRLGISYKDTDGPGVLVQSVEADSNGGHPVLQAGDVLLAANGVPIEDLEAFSAVVQKSGGQPLRISIIREGDMAMDVTMSATQYEAQIDRGLYFRVETAILPAFGQAVQSAWSIFKLTLRSIGMMIAGTVRAQDTIAGPIGVVTLISDVVTQKVPLADTIYSLLWIFALVSVSLGFMNLLPIPPLDGNHLVLIIVEAIRGRRLSEKVQNLIGFIGLAMIIMLAAAGMFFDVMRLINR